MFKGTYTAIVTPFTDANEVDYDKLRELVNFQIEGGVDGIVPCGTTGESPTLSFEEHEKVIKTVIEESNKQVRIIAGTGSNNTVESVHLTKKAADFGADAALVIMPYYNKPMPEGQYLHFKTVAEEGGIPIVVYNVPSRTGKCIEADDIARMFDKIDLVVALKDAVGDIEYTCEVKNKCDIGILSGDDSLTYPMMAVGGDGVISVATNVAPDMVVKMVKLASEGNYAEAMKEHYKLWGLFKTLFVETNPIPVKAALEMMGKISANLRLPMSKITPQSAEALRKVLADLGLV